MVAALLLYVAQRAEARRRDIDAALAMLEALRDGIPTWGGGYFENTFDVSIPGEAQRLKEDTQEAFDAVMTHAGFQQVFPVPTEPLVALVQQPGLGGLIQKETIEAVNFALWQVGVFNLHVQLQADFNARHGADLWDASLPESRTVALANAARNISRRLHERGIGDARWYKDLKAALDANIDWLHDRRSERWWV